MKLQDNYFTIRKISYPNSDTRHGRFKINLLADHPVYEGHFPGEPVCPGVCSLQMVKECAQLMAHEKFLISYIKQYRLLEVMAPQKNPELMVEIHLEQGEKEGTGIIYKMKASGCALGKPEMKYFEISAELSPVR